MSKPFLILNYSLEHPATISPLIAHLKRVGYLPEYRRYLPKILKSDLNSYSGLGIFMAKESEIDGYMTTADQKKLLVEFVNLGKTLLIFTTRPTSLESDREAVDSNDVRFFNGVLNELGIDMKINFDQVYDDVNNYSASLVQPPFYRTLKGHPLNPEGYERLTLGRCCSLSVGADVERILISYPTARAGSTAGEAVVAASAKGEIKSSGRVFLLGKQIFTEIGSLSFSRPLLKVDRIKDSWNFLKRLSEYIREKSEVETHLLPLNPGFRPSTSSFTGYIHGHGAQKRPGIPAFRLKREQNWRDRVDKKLYGWIESEKVRAGWCYINSGDKSYRNRLTDVCKYAKLNLLWGVADSDMTSGGKIEAKADVVKGWDEITEALDPTAIKTHSALRWFMGIQFPHMSVDRNSYPHTVALNGKSCQTPSPVDIDYWKKNIIPTAKEFAKYSLKHPSVGGIMMDLEMYGFPYLFYSDIHDYSDLAFSKSGIGNPVFNLRPSERFGWMMENGHLISYYKSLSDRAEAIGKLYREAIHQVNPNLILGFYAGNIMTSWFYLAFWRGASSKDRPIILLSFNTESVQNLSLMKRERIYMYHASAALMGKFLTSDFEEVISNAAKNGDGYWLNRLTALVSERVMTPNGMSGHYSEIEAPQELDENGKRIAIDKMADKYKAIEAIRMANENLDKMRFN